MATPQGWTEKAGKLTRDFEFTDFAEAWAFMSRVALLAEKLDHHPEWSNVWNKVSIAVTSHDAGSTVTHRDIAFAEGVNRVLPFH